MKQKNAALIKLMLALLAWSSSYAITRTVVASVPPVLFAFLRFGLASLILLIIYYTRREKVKESIRGKWGPVITLALSGVTLYYLFFNFSLQRTSAATGALIQGFIPVSTALLAAIFLREKIKPLQILAIGIAVTGVILIGLNKPATAASGGNSLIGNALMVAAVLCWAVYTVASKKHQDYDPLWLITWMAGIGSLLLIPAVIYERMQQPWPPIPLVTWGAILYMALFPSALGYLWYNSALQHIPASQAGVWINLDFVLGAFIAVIFLGEKLHPWQVVGAALTLAGVGLFMYRNRSTQ